MSAAQKSSQVGLTTLGLLGVAFVVLKLTGYIPWSWWWVTLPFWGPSAIVFVFVIVVVLIAVPKAAKQHKKRRR